MPEHHRSDPPLSMMARHPSPWQTLPARRNLTAQAEPLERCGIIELPFRRDERGSLVFAESRSQIPFEIQRVFVIFDVPPGSIRARHANRRLEEVLVPVAGSVTVDLRSPQRIRTFHLSDQSLGLYIHPLTWLEIRDFDPGSVLLVLASLPYRDD